MHARVLLFAALVACDPREEPREAAPAPAAAPDSVDVAPEDAAPETEEERFTAYLRVFCATLEQGDASWVRANVRLPLPLHGRVTPEACNFGTCRWYSRSATSVNQVRDDLCAPERELSAGFIAPRIRPAGKGWAAYDSVGQFGGWLYFEPTHDGWRLVRYDEAD